MAPPPERPPDAHTTACPCGRGDVPAQLAGQRPLLARAATGAWLTAMSRDAVSDRPGSGRDPAPAGDPVAALSQLPDSEREVLVLRLLCGHTLDHTAHLSGYSRRAVLGLQLAACLAIAERTQGTPAPPGASAEELERRLGLPEIAPATPDPALTAALAAAGALRQAAAEVVAPDPELVASLRHELTSAEPPARLEGPFAKGDPPGAAPHPPGAAPHPPGPLPGPPNGRVAQRRDRGAASSTALPSALPAALQGLSPLRRPWVSTAVATAGIVVLLALQAFGDPGPRPGCEGRPCPVSTTVAVAAEVGSLGTPLTTIVEPSTTTSTAADQAPATTPPRTSASAPPTTRPAPTAPRSTRAPRPTTTTRAPPTTAPTTTVATTTTTAAPAPT